MIEASQLEPLLGRYVAGQRWFSDPVRTTAEDADVGEDEVTVVVRSLEVWREALPGLLWAIVDVTSAR